MKTKKVLLGSLVLAGMFGACTNEEIVVDVQGTDAMANRAQVDLSLNVGVESRMSNGAGFDINFTKNDLMGAVLVDAGYTSAGKSEANKTWNNVNWNIVDGHVGNNKWAYNTESGKFETAGTTAVGAWLFYTKYNEKMTTTRDGVKFHFPQIQDGAANYEKMMNNNINFMVAPIVNIDGYEGEKLNFPIEMNSVYSYLNMKFDFSELKDKKISKVQKIVVSSTKKGAPVEFPLDYKVVNKNVPVAAMSTNAAAIEGVKVPCYEEAPCTLTALKHQELEMARKAAEFRYDSYSATVKDGKHTVSAEWAKLDAEAFNAYKSAIEGVGNAKANTLIVDFEAEHGDKAGNGGLDVVEGKVSAYMLMPAGVYENLTFDIYTNDGVYTVTVKDRNAYRVNANAIDNAADNNDTSDDIKISGAGKIFLRPAKVAVLSDIENAIPSSDLEYIKVTEAIDGNTSTKTPDLINYIKGINKKDTYYLTVVDQDAIGGKPADDATIPVHATVINKAVMDAIVAKEKELEGDIQLVLSGYKNMNVIGEAKEAPLNIHDITFKNGCTVKSGYVKATADLGIAAGKEMLVKSGANVELALTSTTTTLDNTSNFYFAGVEVEKGGVVNVTKTSTINNVENYGSFTIEKPNNTAILVTSDNIINKGTATLKSMLDVRTSFVNTHYTVGTTTYHSTFTNDGEMTILEDATGTNNCTLNNNGAINVQDDFTNNGTILVAATGKIHVNNATEPLGSDNPITLKNLGTITNNGMLYTKVGYNNVIDNIGTINANSGSTTYITTNSKLNEATEGTKGTNQVMGVVKLAERNLDITVTNPNYQGYIQYEVQATDLDKDGKFDSKETPLNQKDKYNKIILKNGAELTAQAAKRVRYIETSKDLVLPTNSAIQEITFTATATLYSEKATIAYLTINKNVLVKVPTENVIGIFDVNNSTSKTAATIYNKGEFLVGGDLYTTLTSEQAKANGGEFSAGDGNNTAFHWGENFPGTSSTTATE